jgi:hypothetical protein
MLEETGSQERNMRATRVCGALLVLALAGCTGDEEAMGPAQKAGKAVDEAGDRVAQGLRAPIDKADEAAQLARERAEEARRQLAERTEAAREKIEDATEEAGRGLQKATGKVGEKVEQAGEKIQGAAH